MRDIDEGTKVNCIGSNLMFDKKNKKVNLSYTFMARSVCKYCMGHPCFYYFVRNKRSHASAAEFSATFSMDYDNICDDFYINLEPRLCHNNSFFKFSICAGYSARMYKNLGANKYGNFIDYAVCKCGKTHWAFPQSLALKRPDIVNRSSRDFYPYILKWD